MLSFILHFRPLGTFLVFTRKLKFCHHHHHHHHHHQRAFNNKSAKWAPNNQWLPNTRLGGILRAKSHSHHVQLEMVSISNISALKSSSDFLRVSQNIFSKVEACHSRIKDSQVPQPTCYRKLHSWQLGNLTRLKKD